MFKKKKSTVNVDEAVTKLMQFAQEDEGFKALLNGIMSQSAVRMQAMTKAWIEELTKKGASAEQIASVTSLLDMKVARKVRQIIKE